MFKSDAAGVKRHPVRYRNPKFYTQTAEVAASLSTRIETLLARDNRPTYYAPDQPELHNAVRDRAQAIYQRAVDRSVDYAAAKAAQLVADRKAEAKKRAAAEEEIILLFLMLMADAGEEAFETSTVGLEGGLGEEPEVVPPAVVKTFIEQRRAVLSGFPVEMSQRLTRIVTDGIERGQTDREIRSTIAKEASAIKKGQGSVVSLTEAQCTYGSAEIRLLKRAGFETCYWVTEGDEKVRQSHRECEEAGEITIGHEFPNGLRFPGDPQGSAAEVCNCRCNLIGGRRKSGIQASVKAGAPIGNTNAAKSRAVEFVKNAKPNETYTTDYIDHILKPHKSSSGSLDKYLDFQDAGGKHADLDEIEVDLSKEELHSHEGSLSRSNLLGMIENPGVINSKEVDEPITIVESGGAKTVVAGNHRASVAKLLGFKFKARIIRDSKIASSSVIWRKKP
jgi:hypothetical protein